MAKRDGLRPWLQSRFVLVLVAVPSVVLGCVLGAAVGAFQGFADTVGEVREAWRILSSEHSDRSREG